MLVIAQEYRSVLRHLAEMDFLDGLCEILRKEPLRAPEIVQVTTVIKLVRVRKLFAKLANHYCVQRWEESL